MRRRDGRRRERWRRGGRGIIVVVVGGFGEMMAQVGYDRMERPLVLLALLLLLLIHGDGAMRCFYEMKT